MRCLIGFFLLFGLTVSGGFSGDAKPEKKGTVVKIDKLESLTPATWVKEKPSNRLRSYQFRLPKAKDDKEDADLAVFPNLIGTTQEILDRWKETFKPPDGKTFDEITRVEQGKIGKAQYIYLDIQGVYQYKDRPMSPAKAIPKPGYRMLSVYFKTPDGPNRIWMVGPEATVAQYKKGFDEWLKNFK